MRKCFFLLLLFTTSLLQGEYIFDGKIESYFDESVSLEDPHPGYYYENEEHVIAHQPVSVGAFEETPWECYRVENPKDVTIETIYKEDEQVSAPYFSIKTDRKSNHRSDEKPPYRLKVGDQLQVFLYGLDEKKTIKVVTVDPGGNISYLYVPSMAATGKTIDELRKDLEKEIKKHLPNVIVALSPVNLSGNFYTIMGEVQQPGTLPIQGNLTLLGAIAQSGGFPLRNYRNQTIDYADLNQAFLARAGEYIPVNFKQLIYHGDLTQDVPLLPGDYIYIPSLLTKKVYCLGEVRRNFVYEYLYPATLMEVVAMAGGTTIDASSRAHVIRGSLDCPIHYSIDMHLITRGCAPDFCIQPGDIVYIPPARFTNLKLILKQALRTFVGAIAFTAGQEAFFQLEPAARFDGETNAVFINPGSFVPPPQPPPPVFISP